MQELQQAERYSIAALFTLALHSVASYSDGGDDSWGYVCVICRSVGVSGQNNTLRPNGRWCREPTGGLVETHTGDAETVEKTTSFWGRDLAADGGLLDAMYWQLGLPCFKWAGLKALPSIASPNRPDVFRSTVRSLISVLDQNLASSLPPLTSTEYQRNRVDADALWDGILDGSSEDEETFDIEQVKRGTPLGSVTPLGSRTKLCDAPKDLVVVAQDTVDECGECNNDALAKEMDMLQDMAQQESHEKERKREYEALAHQIEEYEQESEAIVGNEGVENSWQADAPKMGHGAVAVSPVAVAGMWELLQCVIGASFAASEAAEEIGKYHKERFQASGDTGSGLMRQGPPPCVRWYDARARAALQTVCKWLHVDTRKLVTLEVLLGSDRAPATARPGRSKVVSDEYRYWKVGAAAVGGGALFAVTGGLAAPAIAAGVGSILGIVPGAGAAAASVAGFMSTQAGVAALTTTMATAGAATTGSKMAYRTAEVKDFGFFNLGESIDSRVKPPQVAKRPPIPSDRGHVTLPAAPQVPSSSQTTSTDKKQGSESWKKWFSWSKDSNEENKMKLSPIPSLKTPKIEGIKLSTLIGVSGWVTSTKDYIAPWTCVNVAASDRYAIVWCTQELVALSSALGGLIAKGAAGQAARYGVQHLLAGASGLVTALGPTVILGAAAGLLIENAWTIAADRSDKSGRLLAHILMEGGSGGRPVTLVAHSMGARLAVSSLLELAAHDARGLVQDVILMGTPLTLDDAIWTPARRVVAGRLINCYSSKDWLLSVMYWQGVSKPAAGLMPIPTSGIDNLNCSEIVSGHADYVDKLDEILEDVIPGGIILRCG